MAVQGPATGSRPRQALGGRSVSARGESLVRVSHTGVLAVGGVLAGAMASLRALAGVRRRDVRPSWASGALVGRRGAFRARSGLSRSSGGSSCSLGVAGARGGGVDSCHRGLVSFWARPRVFARKSKKNRSLARHKAMIIVPYPAHGEATKDKKAEVMTMLHCKNRFKIL